MGKGQVREQEETGQGAQQWFLMIWIFLNFNYYTTLQFLVRGDGIALNYTQYITYMIVISANMAETRRVNMV